ncbi:MATE family efflux transporter [Sphingobium sp. AN641]|uniref:MATE family efflux transporter n=1 Tax=Sphingobium sp. AN641 TaxID=3133443 RepID=UPI0030C16FD8
MTEQAGASDAGPLFPEATDTKAALRAALLQGPIIGTIARLSLPTIGVFAAQALGDTANTYYASRLGTDALIGVSVVFPIWMLMTMMYSGGLGGAVAAAVARAIGAERDRDADDHVLHAIILGIVMGALFMVIVWRFGPFVFANMGATGAALDQALSFSFWIFLSAIPLWIASLCSAALRGAGDVRTPALLVLGAALVLVVVAPVPVLGLGGFPRLGVVGTGVVTVLYWTGATIWLLIHLGSGRAVVRLRWSRLRWTLFWEVLKVGLPTSLGAVLLNGSIVLITGAMGTLGAAELAGYSLGARLDYVVIPVLFGLGTSVLILVGACVGAGDIDRAKRVTLYGSVIAAGAVGLVGLVVTLRPSLWIGIFSQEPSVLATATIYLGMAGPVYGTLGVIFVLNFAAQGAGRPVWTTLAEVARLVIAGGLGWIAIERFGADMAGLSRIVAIANVSAALICVMAFWTGLVWPRQSEARPFAKT